MASFSETNRLLLEQNPFILEKIQMCIQILKTEVELNPDTFESFNYHHMNVLVLCLESIALQDLHIKLNGTRPPRPQPFPELNELRNTIFEESDSTFAKHFRNSVIHKGIYQAKEMELMINEDYRNALQKLFLELLSFFEIVKKRIQSILNTTALEKYVVNIVEFFEPIEKIAGISGKIPKKDYKHCQNLLKEQLTSVLTKAYENSQDELSNQNLDEVFYRLTVNAVAIIDIALKGQNEENPIALIKNERGYYIHEFNKSCVAGNKILQSRQLRMLQFLREQRFHLFKLYFALIVHEKINEADSNFWIKDGEKLFENAKTEIQDNHNFLTIRKKQNITPEEFDKIVLTYLKVMPEIDKELAEKQRFKREIQFKTLDGIDRRDICEEFQKFERNEQDASALQNKILAKGVTQEEFKEMLTSFKNPKLNLTEILTKINRVKKDYCCSEEARTLGLFKIPDYRRIKLGINNLEEKILGMFLDISIIHEATFIEIKFVEIMNDSTFLQCLLRLNQKLPDDSVIQTLADISYFSPFLAQLIVRDRNPIVSVDDKQLPKIVEDLTSLRSTISVESLRNIIHHFNESGNPDRLKTIIQTFLNQISKLTDKELFKFIGLFYVKFEWQKGKPCYKLNSQNPAKLDRECLKIFLEKLETGSNHGFIIQWLSIVQKSAVLWYQYEKNKITESTDFLNLVIQSQVFQSLSFWNIGRLETLTCAATLTCKLKLNKIPVVVDQILLESKYILLADYVITELSHLYKQAEQLARNCYYGEAYRIYEYLFEAIFIRSGAQAHGTLWAERIGDLNQENLKNRMIFIEQDCSQSISTGFACSTPCSMSDIISDFRNLYDVAFIVSQLENNHQMAFDIYQHLKNSILIRCGITTILAPISYKALLNSSIYQEFLYELDYWDVLTVMRHMGFEQIQMAQRASAVFEYDLCRGHYKCGIEIYEEVINLEDPSSGINTLKTCARNCFGFSQERWLPCQEKIVYLEKSKRYYEKALEISKLIYSDVHPSIILLKKKLDNVLQKLTNYSSFKFQKTGFV